MNAPPGSRMTVRRDLPPMPPGVAALPVDTRGFPVPWFVQWENDDGPCDAGDAGARPLFPVMDSRKLARALREGRCWICGRHLPSRRAYVVGPMCIVNRTSGEPPSHFDCGTFAALACPFLVNPQRRRKPRDERTVEPAGRAVYRNPGVAVLWETRGTRTKPDYRGGTLFDLGDPITVAWYAHGRPATRAEALESLESGVELLRDVARLQGANALAELAFLTMRARRYLPAA